MLKETWKKQRELHSNYNSFEDNTVLNIGQNHPLYTILTQLNEGQNQIQKLIKDIECLNEQLENLNLVFWMAAKNFTTDIQNLNDNESLYIEPTETSFNIIKRTHDKKAELKNRLKNVYNQETDKSIKQHIKKLISEIS